MKADENGPDGIPARVIGPAGPDRLAVLCYPDLERFDGGIRAEDLPVGIVPVDLRGEGSYLLLTRLGTKSERRFATAIPLPRYELRIVVPGPFTLMHGREFVEHVVGPLEETLCRLGLANYVHPWTFPDSDSDEWECMCSVTDLRRAITVTRETLAGLRLPSRSVIVVWGPEEKSLRTYPLEEDEADWTDLPEVERRARYSLEEAVHKQSPCW
jgi:hypothetical protein